LACSCLEVEDRGFFGADEAFIDSFVGERERSGTFGAVYSLKLLIQSGQILLFGEFAIDPRVGGYEIVSEDVVYFGAAVGIYGVSHDFCVVLELSDFFLDLDGCGTVAVGTFGVVIGFACLV
jgi:hypothetical protein